MTLKDKTLDVEAYKRQREEFLKKRRKLGKKKHHAVMVMGTGALGMGTVGRIVDKQYFGSLDISKVYLIGSSLRRAQGIAKDYQDAGHAVIPGDYSSIADWKDICDVIFIATDNHKANKRYKNKKTVPADIREKMTLNNLALIDDIAARLNAGEQYQGTVIMGTNQVDLLSMYLAQQMGIDPRQIVGLNQIDTLRFRNLLLSDIKAHSEQLLPNPRAAAEFLNNCFVIGAHKGTMVPVVSNIAYANIPADRIEFLKQAIEQIKPQVINRGPEEFEDTGQIASVTPTLAAAEMIEAIITEQKLVTGATFLDFKELIFTDDAAFDICKGKIPKPVHIGFPIYFKDGKAELLPQWSSEEEREAQLQWFWRLSDADKLAFIESAADIRGEFDGMLDEGRVKEPIQKSIYCFTRRVDKEADYPAIDLDTVVFSLDSENPARINMYKPGLSLKPRKDFTCDLKKLESIQQVCADHKTLAALVLSSNPRSGKDSYKVLRWNLETGDFSEFEPTNKPLSSIALQGDDVVCSVHNRKDIAAVYSPDGTVSFRTAGENRPMSLIATGDGAMFGISENKIYHIRENQADLVTDKIKAEVSDLKVLSTDKGRLLVASGYKSNKVYFIDPATSVIAAQDSKQGICAIDTDKEGNIYLATIRKNRPFILKYDSIESMMQDPPSSHVKGPEEIKNATSLEFDNDYLFVFDVRDRIYLVDREFPDLEHKPLKLEQAWTSDSDNYAWVKKC